MASIHLHTLLDATAGELVTVDYDSVQDVIALCASLEKLRDAAIDAGYRRIPDTLNRAVELINAIATEESCDRNSVVDILNKLFSTIQHALRPGSDPEKLRLPKGLEHGVLAHAYSAPQTVDQPFTLPDYVDRDIFLEFINDQDSILANLEELLLRLEHCLDQEAVGDIRRLFHTLKGEAGVFELRQVERLCHATEDLIEAQPDAIPVDVLLCVKDWLKHCFDALKLGSPVPPFSSEILSILLHVPDTSLSIQPLHETAVPSAAVSKKFELSPFIAPEIFEIFIEEQDHALEKIDDHIAQIESGPDMEAVVGLKRIFHTLNGGAGVCGLTDVERVCTHVEDAIEKDPAALSYATMHSIRQWLKSVFDALKDDETLPSLPDTLLEQLLLKSTDDEPVQESRAGEVFVDDDIFNDFVDEQQSVAVEIESLLLKLDTNPDAPTVDKLKRVFHTLKGEARVFGLTDIEKLCHAVESLLDRYGSTPPVDTLFGVKDFLSRCFRALKSNTDQPELTQVMLDTLMPLDVDVDGLTAAVVYNPLKGPVEFKVSPDDISPESDAPQDRFATAQNQITADLDLLSDFVSEVKEHIDHIDDRLLSLEHTPGDNDLLNAVFRVFHTIKGAAGFLALDDISRLAHVTESLLDCARKGERLLEGASIDVVFEAVDEMKSLVGIIETAISSGDCSYPSSVTVDLLVDKIKHILTAQPQQSTPAVSEINTDISVHSPPHATVQAVQHSPVVEHALTGNDTNRTPDSNEYSSDDNEASSDADEFLEILDDNHHDNLEEPEPSRQQQTTQHHRIRIKESIKVDAENLDKLIDAIGELVIIEAMIRQDSSIRTAASSTLLRNITQMDKITRELQTLGMSLRMIPIKATFQKMARVVRDLAKKSGKKIEFVTQGEDTMLDKSVVDRIGDPLIHLVRNAVDHGIESTHEDRRRAGKNPVGRICLTAFHKGGNIFVEISDDGRGLNRQAIQSKAIERGIIRDSHQLTDREIFNTILLPGFSTARKVTDVSGRGVGMDVVKRTIEDLRGNIDIISSPGSGTTISLRLPLTLAIIDGMLVRIGTERYIIPTLSIVESVRPRMQDITTVINKGEMISIRDKLIPLFRLADLFNIKGALKNIEDSIVIVVEDSGSMTGIMVDELLGQQSTVIKSLGALKGLTGISGGSIMTDGSVGIILDIAGIVKLAVGKEHIKQNV
jgi:two-component system, chemotaxis family, sensor kinase CheA